MRGRLSYKTMSLGERIIERMRILGIDRARVIKATGATKGTVSNWISNKTAPNAEYITALCDVLHCSSEYLLEGIPDVEADNQGNVIRIQ